ncbi:hypothetical protein ATE84_1185 [Aquimarina sp. MAR_2010_214]|uniref:hypothetical protein n=1 Tax=Aquimarina sp. MAR_2010_214 TaxID=1250026 RepID=UPI000C704067|nr:hypothetical protein [Aquimarina sp. MAR_2010_214]PKV49168.1 hypothetical protein ATE84_1185 [Aquimarina sp. MAR_2010_214]
MLQSILKLKQVKLLDRKAKVNINGGGINNTVCPKEGDICSSSFLLIPCMGPADDISCVNGVWTSCSYC